MLDASAPEVILALPGRVAPTRHMRSTILLGKTGGTLFGTILRLAKGAGVTPWTVLPLLQRFWDRGYDGGGIRVARHGPKDARMELV